MPLDTWKKLVSGPVAELLKKHGFKKSGLRFSASRPGVTLLISLQSSDGSTKERLKITCNLGISVDKLVTSSTVDVWNAHWRERIGFFLAQPYDHWWLCQSDEDAVRCGQEMAALLEERGLPTMESLASSHALAELWSTGSSPGLTEKQRVEYLSLLNASMRN